MSHGTYVGPIAHLRGKSALLQPCSALRDCVLAQFDDQDLTRSGKPLPQLPEPPADALGFGWHAFPASDFEEDRNETDS